MYKKWMEILSANALFQGIHSEDIDLLLKCLQASIYKYNKEEYIAKAGEPLHGIGIVLAGEALVTKETAAGQRVIMTRLNPGDMFGEIAAFAGGGRWPAAVFVPNRCSVIFLPPDRIIGECAKLCDRHHSLILNLLRIIASKALMLNRKTEYLVMKSLRSRLSLFLLEQIQKNSSTAIHLPMNRNELADFLNVSRPSLSREMCRMRDEGFIRFDKASVQILNVEELQNMVEPLN